MGLTKGKFFLASHGLIKKGNKYLITKRTPGKHFKPNYWDIPGGTVELGEKLDKALKREVAEETTLKIKVGKIVDAFTFISPTDKNMQVTQLTYSCEYVSGQVKLNASEHTEYAWVTKNEMKNYKLIPFVKELTKKL